MPRFVRVSSVNNQYRTLFQSKSQIETVNGDIYPRTTFMAEDTPVGYCEDAAKDLNWFLAVGGREESVSSCQLGVSYEPLNTTEAMIFPGEYAYSIRSKKNVTRKSLEFYTRNGYIPLPPLTLTSYTYLPSLLDLTVTSYTYII